MHGCVDCSLIGRITGGDTCRATGEDVSTVGAEARLSDEREVAKCAWALTAVLRIKMARMEMATIVAGMNIS